jgi:predicted transcriptional regulator
MEMSDVLKAKGMLNKNRRDVFPEFLNLTPKARIYLAELRKNLQKKRAPSRMPANITR